jgi:hypothetical protein
MLEMLRAHGLDAGPTQRPVAAGALTGLIAEAPTLALLVAFGSLERMSASAPALTVAIVHAVSMVLAGVGYGLLFQRAANDPAGGWLFGMAYGYLIWQAVAVPVLQWLPDAPLLAGKPALGLLLAHLLWGLLVGLGFRRLHRPFQHGIDEPAPAAARKAGWR